MIQKPKDKKLKKNNHFDLLFKYAFSIPRFAEELFQLIFSKQEQDCFDWSTLRAEKDTFQDLRADAVFSVALKDHKDLRFRICLLLEHKSQYSYKIFDQMLKYQTLITGKSLEELGKAWPTLVVLVYNGPKPWKWEKSFQKGLFSRFFSKIPASIQKNMLNYELRVLDTQDPRVERAIQSSSFKSRGFLNALRKAWSLKADEKELRQLISLFDTWTGDRGDSLVLSLGDYLWSVVPNMNKALWESLEHSAVKEGIFSKGGYMDIKEHIKEEGRQEGIRQGIQQGMQQGMSAGIEKGRQELILSMLKKSADLNFISEVTGLSVKKLKQFKNGDSE